MERKALGAQRYGRLMKVSEAARDANSFGLFLTGNRLEGLQHEMTRFQAAPERLKAGRAERVIKRAERAEEKLEDEHTDVGLAHNVKWRARRGLITACALFAAQLATAAVTVLKPWFTPDFLEKYHPTTIVGAVILALAAFPVRDFIFVHRFERLKERVGAVLEDVKADMGFERDSRAEKGRQES